MVGSRSEAERRCAGNGTDMVVGPVNYSGEKIMLKEK